MVAVNNRWDKPSSEGMQDPKDTVPFSGSTRDMIFFATERKFLGGAEGICFKNFAVLLKS